MKLTAKVLPYLFTLTVVLAYFIIGPRTILDVYLAWRYQPTNDISSLEQTITFTGTGKRIFYASNPQVVSSKEAFRHDCTDSEATIVLGCYVNERSIYILDVTDERLRGIEEVTAVHEFLHAVYARMSSSERSKIDQLTEAYAATITDESFKKTIESYRKKDASSVPNELHSIIGSEYKDIPKELEDHYQKYITNRTDIVTLAGAYSAVFSSLESQISEYNDSLKKMEENINTTKQELSSLSTSLEQERTNLENQRNMLPPDEFNILVRAFNKKVATYNALIDTLNTEVSSYNTTLEKRNAIVLTREGLYQSIDTRSLPEKL